MDRSGTSGSGDRQGAEGRREGEGSRSGEDDQPRQLARARGHANLSLERGEGQRELEGRRQRGGGDESSGASGSRGSVGSVLPPDYLQAAEEFNFREWLNNRDWLPGESLASFQEHRLAELRRGYRQPPSSPAVAAAQRYLEALSPARGAQDGSSLDSSVSVGEGLGNLQLSDRVERGNGLLSRQSSSNNLNVMKASTSRSQKCEGKKGIGHGKKKLNIEDKNKFKGADEEDLPPTFRWVEIEIEKE